MAARGVFERLSNIVDYKSMRSPEQPYAKKKGGRETLPTGHFFQFLSLTPRGDEDEDIEERDVEVDGDEVVRALVGSGSGALLSDPGRPSSVAAVALTGSIADTAKCFRKNLNKAKLYKEILSIDQQRTSSINGERQRAESRLAAMFKTAKTMKKAEK